MKEDFDQCESETECKSGKCSNGRCISSEIQVSSQLSLNVMIILVFLMLIIVVTTCYFAKVKSDQAESLSNYRRQRSTDSANDADGDHPDGQHHGHNRRRRRQRDEGSRHREASSSSERRRHHRRGTDQTRGSSPSQRLHSQSSNTQMRSDDFTMRKSGGQARRLSDGNGPNYTSEELSKENLEKLSRQANSAKHGGGPDTKRGNEPALLFVEDDHQHYQHH